MDLISTLISYYYYELILHHTIHHTTQVVKKSETKDSYIISYILSWCVFFFHRIGLFFFSDFFFFFLTFTSQLLDKPWSQVGVVPSPPRFLPSIFIAHRVQQSHCSSMFHRMLLTHALALSASQFVHKKSPNEFIRVCTRWDSNSRN